MPSKAERIVAIVSRPEWTAVTLQYGYAVNQLSGQRMAFEPGHVEEVKRRDGRCTKMVLSYQDGSRIHFTWSESHGPQYEAIINGRVK